MAKNNVKKNARGYNYKYTDLAQIHEYLEEQGFEYYQEIERLDGDDYVITVKISEDGKEQRVRGCRVVQGRLDGKTNPAQEQGSALTYARRYSLLMAYGLATTDDDAQLLTTENKLSEQEMHTLKVALDDINKAKTIVELTAIWNTYKPLQNVNEFIQAVKLAKTALNEKK